MLYYITSEIVDAAEKKDNKAIDTLEHLAAACEYGKHFVFAENRELLRRLVDIKEYNNRKTSSIYSHILNKYSTLSPICGIVSLKVIFTVEKQATVKVENDQYLLIKYPIDNVTLNNLTNEVKLLGENLIDISFYAQVCDYYKKKNKYNIKIEFSSAHGGGQTIGKVLEHEHNENKNFCLAFLDSDKTCPNNDGGKTLKEVKVRRKKDVPYYTTNYIYSSKYREIENLIPFDILKGVGNNVPNYAVAIRDLEKIIQAGKSFSFYDIKNGMCCEKYYKIKKLEKLYVNELIELIGIFDLKDLELEKIPKDTKLLHGFGDQILEHAISYIKQELFVDPSNISFPAELEKEWDRYGQEIINWACASNPIRL